ncbi:tetraspanin-8-like [Syngnathoides biaculeatus]|uniref:tetraspanin-8-like n=1 Tax=Syngnathoides biaculeatus TaxID=300417 RepID=UPI002ADE8E46|nr:tetraspanin-8-like [Syngnathoides biaculeatus]
MTQVNSCVKISLIVSNVFFAIVGGACLCLALLLQVLTHFSDASLEGRSAGLTLLYVAGAVTVVVAVVGAYGAIRQSRPALVAFLVCMVIGTLLMLRVGTSVAATRPEIEGGMAERFRQLLPLDVAKEKTQIIANAVQEKLHCCGLFGSDDWRQKLPDSCLCDALDQVEGKCHDVSYKVMTPQKKSVFQPCFPIIVRYVFLAFDVVTGIAFVLATLALLGLTLSSILIHQLRASARPAVLLVPTIFKPGPPKYRELHDVPVVY